MTYTINYQRSEDLFAMTEPPFPNFDPDELFIQLIESRGFSALTPTERTNWMLIFGNRCLEYANDENTF